MIPEKERRGKKSEKVKKKETERENKKRERNLYKLHT